MNRMFDSLFNSIPKMINEMEILKHMYQYGDAGQTFPAQVAISATILEQTK